MDIFNNTKLLRLLIINSSFVWIFVIKQSVIKQFILRKILFSCWHLLLELFCLLLLWISNYCGVSNKHPTQYIICNIKIVVTMSYIILCHIVMWDTIHWQRVLEISIHSIFIIGHNLGNQNVKMHNTSTPSVTLFCPPFYLLLLALPFTVSQLILLRRLPCQAAAGYQTEKATTLVLVMLVFIYNFHNTAHNSSTQLQMSG